MDLVKLKQQTKEKETPKASQIENKIEEAHAAADLEKALEAAKKPRIKIERRIKFPISYQDLESDRTLKAVLVSKVMDSEARLKYDQVLMTLTGGFPYEDYPATQKTRFQCLARIICQLEDTDQWVLEKAGEDLDFCFAVASKLVEHENRYFRYYDGENKSEEKKPRFSVDFPEFEEIASA